MIPPVSPNQLAGLAVLLKTASVSKAAAQLGLSQPSVSRILSQLRAALNDPLLVRTGNEMVRTPRGEELAERLDEWMTLTAGLLATDTFSPDRLARRFRVATTDFGVLSVLAPALPAIHAAAPGAAIDMVPLSSDAHTELARGDIDMAVSGLEHDPSRLHGHLLFEDTFACVMRPDHPLARSLDAPLPLDQFLAYPHIGLVVSDAQLDRVQIALGSLGATRKVAASLPYFSIAPDLLSAGDLLMTLPGRAAQRFSAIHDLAVRPAPAEMGRLNYWLLWHERSHRDAASTWLREQLIAATHLPGE